MAIVFEKTKVKGGFPIFWRGEFAVLPGDFKLKGTYPEGTKIPKGTPIKLDFDNMECSICKSARVLSGGTTTAPHVKKGSMLQVGDAVKVGESNSTVKSIDTKNADYDVITFAAAVTGATEGRPCCMASGLQPEEQPRNQVCTTVKEEVNNERSILFIHFRRTD